ncbi:MAG: pyridoxamine 5'-phosphate oxidase family protein [Anaerolineales bacterium]
MPSYHPSITEEQVELLRDAPIFFVATADPALDHGPGGIGPVNLSPKGGVPLHILSPNRVAFLDYASSGNETARHSLTGGPITAMVCSFEAGDAAIVRLFGKATVTPLTESPLADVLREHPAEELKLAERQVIEIEIESTMTSCGYDVPVMAFAHERRTCDRGRRYKQPR